MWPRGGHQVTGGVVVHHQEDHLALADQTGHVVLGDVFGLDRKARASNSRASSRDFTSALLPRPEKACRAALPRSNRSPSMRVSRAGSSEYCR